MTATHPIRAEAEPLFQRFQLNNDEARPGWIEQLRKSAMAWFAENGFPTSRQEDWRFTNVAPITSLALHPSEGPWRNLTNEEIRLSAFGQLDCYRLVFVDGHFVPALSAQPDGELEAGSLRDYIASGKGGIEQHLGHHASFDPNPFAALNTAFFRDGAFVRVPARRVVTKPIHLLFLTTATEPDATALPRNLILAGKESSVTVIESYASLSDLPCLTNAVTELSLETGARIEHCKIQNESENAFHIATLHATQAADSHWLSHSISIGARIARNHIHAALSGQGADCLLNGLYMARGEQLVDHHTLVDHIQPRCESHEFYHGVLDDNSRGVFNGKIFVRQDAQKTNARQTNRNLLLSENAMIDTKPQLEIFADDVKCSHGATVGQLDEDQLFYLRARGIGLESARRMLIRAFASAVIERIPVAEVRAELEHELDKRFV